MRNFMIVTCSYLKIWPQEMALYQVFLYLNSQDKKSNFQYPLGKYFYMYYIFFICLVLYPYGPRYNDNVIRNGYMPSGKVVSLNGKWPLFSIVGRKKITVSYNKDIEFNVLNSISLVWSHLLII